MDDLIAPLDADIAKALNAEIRATRNKLNELEKLAREPFGRSSLQDYPRVSIGITREEFNQLQNLARRCKTSISALGQLAIKHLLVQSSTGAMPMLPTTLTMNYAMSQPTVAELEEQMEEQKARFQEEMDASQARINILDAQIELDRLAALANAAEPSNQD